MRTRVHIFFIERFLLKRRGKLDAKRNLFQDNETGKRFLPKQYDFDQSAKAPHVISSFIKTELRTFNLVRDYQIERKKVKIYLMDSDDYNKRNKEKMRFSEALAYLEGQIKLLRNELDKMELACNAEVSKLETECEIRSCGWAEHIIKLYDSKILATKEKFSNDALSHYKNIVLLLNEKIRLWETMEDQLNTLFAKKCLRISIYYSGARLKVPDLPLASISKEYLLAYCDSAILGKYEGRLSEDKNLRDNYLELMKHKKQDIDIVSQGEEENVKNI